MADRSAPGPSEQVVAAFVASTLHQQPTRIARTDAFATNAVYEVDANDRRLMVKASMNRDALRAEAWACASAVASGFPAPDILVDVRGIGDDARMGAFVMSRIPGEPIRPGHQLFANWAGASVACTKSESLGLARLRR